MPDSSTPNEEFRIPMEVPMQPVLEQLSVELGTEIGRLTQKNIILQSRIEQLTRMLIDLGGKFDG